VPFDFFQPHVVTALSALLGASIGGYFSTRSQKRERQQQHIRRQLTEFYGPLLALRAQILAKSELPVKISGAADSAWRKEVEWARSGGHEAVRDLRDERSAAFHKIVDDENRIFTEDIVPAYRRMIEIFSSAMYLAEPATIAHFPALVEFVEIWNRSLGKGLPGEVALPAPRSVERTAPVALVASSSNGEGSSEPLDAIAASGSCIAPFPDVAFQQNLHHPYGASKTGLFKTLEGFC
jgi:hypothetical protein